MVARSKRLVVILVVGTVFVLAAGFYVRHFLARPIGHGPAGPPVARTEFSRVWTERPVCVVGLGDSITAGLGAASPSHSFFQRLLANPVDEYPDMRGLCLSQVLPQLRSQNLAVSGSKSKDHLIVINERLETFDEDVFGVVMITTGGNDLIHSYGRSPPRECAMYGATLRQAAPWITAFGQRLDQMLDGIDARFPGGCEIYLADIYDPTDGIGDAPSVHLPHWPDGLAIHAAYNAVIIRAAGQRPHVHVVPLHQTFLGHGSHCRQFWRTTYVADDPYYWYYDNIEDPNDRGYDAIRRAFLNTMLQHSQLLHSGVQDQVTP